MIRASTVTLISALPDAHGVYDAPYLTDREVACDVQSVTRNEAYAALNHGLHPECVLVLSNYAEYQGETTCCFENYLYKILRTYIRPDQSIELVIERMRNHDV